MNLRIPADSFSLLELCEKLSISMATGRNWIKLGKLSPQYTETGTPYFSKKYVEELNRSIESDVNMSLKKRRNKKFITGNDLYNSYVSEKSQNVKSIEELFQIADEQEIHFEDDLISTLIADCAIKLWDQRMGKRAPSRESRVIDFMDGKIDFGIYNRLIEDIISDRLRAKKLVEAYPEIFNTLFFYEDREDILGLLYISCKNIGNRKRTGSYYTPTRIVHRVIEKLVEKNGSHKSILDPCCGTGNFLLQLPDAFSIDNIHGMDIDLLSVKIARLNLALHYLIDDISIVYQNIICENYLQKPQEEKYDLIVGNPPWGYNFTEEEYQFLWHHYNSVVGSKVESYDVFIEKALGDLKVGGVMSFVLPEAILNVKSHMPIRTFIVENCNIQYIEFLGNVFDKVQCPSLILQLENTNKKSSCIGMEVNDGKRTYSISKKRVIDPAYFSFFMTDSEYDIIEKIARMKNVVFLKNNADFAIGIVTGNNKKFLSNKRDANKEPILKGSDLRKYKIKHTDNYIEFQPDNFQQVAATEYFRAPEKLLYRFICNQLVFAYDDKQRLSLNSCNIMIPHIPEVSIKYILAILNSRVAQFLFEKKFYSLKILRSHMEQLPIPKVSEKEQKEIITKVNRLLGDLPEEDIYTIYEELDQQIANLYSLTDEEYEIIKEAVDKGNKYLV